MPDQIGSMRQDIGRLEGSIESLIKTVERVDQNSSESRRRVYEKLEGLGTAMHQIGTKIDGAEKEIKALKERVSDLEPSVAEYRIWVTRVRAAGWLGRTLWAVGGALLAAAAFLVSSWDAVIKFFRT